jgi:hypothetical protein
VYRYIRTTHLILGLLSGPFLLMYAASAIQMAHRSWFPVQTTVRQESALVRSGCDNPRALAHELMQREGWRGELIGVSRTAQALTVRIASVGTTHDVACKDSAKKVDITTRTLGFVGVLNRMHHATGIWHSSSPMKVWAAAVALTCVALVGLAGSGLWLWLLRKGERRIGLILVGANLAFSLTVLALLRMGAG